MTAIELGRRLGWSQSYVARRLDGRIPFGLDDLERVASALGVDIITLLTDGDGHKDTYQCLDQPRRPAPVGPRAHDVRARRVLTERAA
jgi:transcriptional regulator with XRE-family HTH domain